MTVTAPGKPYFTSSSSTFGDNNPHTEAVGINRVEALPPELSSNIVSYLGWNEQSRMCRNRLFKDSVLRYWQGEYRDPLRIVTRAISWVARVPKLIVEEEDAEKQGEPLPLDLGSLTVSYWDDSAQSTMIQLDCLSLTNVVAKAQREKTLGFIKEFQNAFRERESNGRDSSIEEEPRLQAEIELESHLLSAIEHGHIASVEEFFDHFPHGLADPETMMRQALHRAAEYGHTAIVALIIQKTGNTLKDSLDNTFYVAVLRRRVDTVKFLIGQLSDKLTDNRFAGAAMSWIEEYCGDINVWEAFLQLPQTQSNNEAVNSVFIAGVGTGNTFCVKTFFDVAAHRLIDDTLFKSLRTSISREHVPITKLLLEEMQRRMDINTVRECVENELREAMIRGRISIVEWFLTTVPDVLGTPVIRRGLKFAGAYGLDAIAELLFKHVRDHLDEETLIEAHQLALKHKREIFANRFLGIIHSWTKPEPEEKAEKKQ